MYLSALVRSGDGGALVALPLREPVRVVARGRRCPGRHRGPLECQGVPFPRLRRSPSPPGSEQPAFTGPKISVHFTASLNGRIEIALLEIKPFFSRLPSGQLW